MCLQHAESAFDGYNRGGTVLVCLLSVCFRFFPTSESKKSTCATMHE